MIIAIIHVICTDRKGKVVKVKAKSADAKTSVTFVFHNYIRLFLQEHFRLRTLQLTVALIISKLHIPIFNCMDEKTCHK